MPVCFSFDITSISREDLETLMTDAPPGQTFIPDMDEIIRASRGNEISSLRRGDMVEIIGPSGSGMWSSFHFSPSEPLFLLSRISHIVLRCTLTPGKTSLLLFLALTRVLPPSITLDLPGPSSDPITINLGGRSDYITLISPTTHRSPMTILHKRLKSHIEGHVLDTLTSLGKSRKIGIVLETTISVHVEDALKRVRLVRVKPRWKSFYLGLKQIIDPPHLVVPTGGTTSKDEEVRVDMLLIDGFSDPFWPERWKSEQRGFEKKSDRVKSSDDVGLRDVVSLLETIRRELGSVIVLTLQALWVGFLAISIKTKLTSASGWTLCDASATPLSCPFRP